MVTSKMSVLFETIFGIRRVVSLLCYFKSIMMVFPTVMLWLLPQAMLAENIVFPSDAGVVNVKQSPYFAYGDGIHDDTAAIQQALNNYPNGNRIIYLPNGTYLVSNTLTWPAGSSGITQKRTILQGQSRDGTIIKLKDSCPGYQDNLKAVIWTGLEPAQRFRNAIRNVTVNTGSGNPGACGIQFNCSNQGGIRDVKIISEDGQGIYGLDMSYTDEIGPMLIRNLHVVGFYFGIITGYTVNSMTLEHITLEGQRSYGFINGGQVVSIRGLTSYNSVTAVRNDSGSSCMVLIDANLVGTGSAFSLPAIANAATLYARNITTSGYQKAIDNTGGNGKDVDGQTVTEFVSHDIISQFPSGQTSLNLPVKEVPTVPWDDLSEWVNPERYGAKGNDTLDDTAAFQAAIDSGKTTVYIPAGRTFYIQGTLRIRGNVRRIIGTEGRLQGNGTIIFEDGTYPTVIFERFDAMYANPVIQHAASRTLVLSTATIDGGIIGTGSGDFFLDDVCACPLIFSNPRQRIWARQIDPERGDIINIDNQGAMLWILGLKTERGCIKVNTTGGGYTELLGAHIYSTTETKVDPILCIDNASASFAGVRETNYNNYPYNDYVKEIRYTNYPPIPEYQIVRVLTRMEAPGGGAGSGRVIPLYAGYVSYDGCDFDHDHDVDLYDFAVFAPAWMSSHGDENWNPLCDISQQADYVVNASDLAVFTEYWLVDLRMVAHWKLDEMEGIVAEDSAGDNNGPSTEIRPGSPPAVR